MNTSSKDRFGFGRNWQNYAQYLSEQQIHAAMESLNTSLGIQNFSDQRILDAGCGSGLFSLAACRLGAKEVVSFDYDYNSVSCTQDVKNRFGAYSNWEISQGDILDQTFLHTLGYFDIVYSWGVLHHTGKMWQAIENVCSLVKPGGSLFISIYNDQGWISRVWRMIKRSYVISPRVIQNTMAFSWYLVVIVVRIFSGLWHKKPFPIWFKGSERGMNLWHDVVDWVGGYPFEVASVETLKNFISRRGFSLVTVRLKSGSGCNELVFKRTSEKS